MNKILKNKYILLLVGLVIGGTAVWFIKPSNHQNIEESNHQHISTSDNQIWTCAMHPQIRQNELGKCPICAMDLTPLDETSSGDDPKIIQMSKQAAKIANVQTTIIGLGTETGEGRKITLQGKIEIDERNITKIPAHFHGRIEKLYVNFTGEQVSKGQLLAEIYSPELIVAQEELLQSLKYKESNPPMYKAAKNKLKFWKIADSEIERVEESGEIQTKIKIHSHHAGVVLKRNVAQGDHVTMGDILLETANLNQLWALFDAYEKDLEWIKEGAQIEFTVVSLPGKVFKSTVSFIDPVIDAKTRVAKVRAEVNNNSGHLKPEMFAYGTLNIPVNGKQQNILVPQSAVLWTGIQSLVYMKKPGFEQPTFEYRQISIGSEIGDKYIVKSGLSIGDEVVTRGAFTIDAAAQLSGKTSMMNPDGNAANQHIKPSAHQTISKSANQTISKSNHQHISTSNHQHISTSNHQQISESNHQQISTSNHQQISESNHQQISESNHQQISTSNHQQISTSNHQQISTSNHQHIKPSAHQTISTSANHTISTSNHQHIKPSANQHIKPSANQHIKPSANQIIESSFWVGGNCSFCKDRIEGSLKNVSGILFADWNVNSKTITVKYDQDKIKENIIHEKISSVGHDTEKMKAIDEVYNNLMGCCKYERKH